MKITTCGFGFKLNYDDILELYGIFSRLTMHEIYPGCSMILAGLTDLVIIREVHRNSFLFNMRLVSRMSGDFIFLEILSKREIETYVEGVRRLITLLRH